MCEGSSVASLLLSKVLRGGTGPCSDSPPWSSRVGCCSVAAQVPPTATASRVLESGRAPVPACIERECRAEAAGDQHVRSCRLPEGAAGGVLGEAKERGPIA